MNSCINYLKDKTKTQVATSTKTKPNNKNQQNILMLSEGSTLMTIHY